MNYLKKNKLIVSTEIVSTVLNKRIGEESNNSAFIESGELHFFNPNNENSEVRENMPVVVFLNLIHLYCANKGYNISIFGCANSDEVNDNIYEATITHGFNVEDYKTKEAYSREEVVLECFDWLIKNKNIKE